MYGISSERVQRALGARGVGELALVVVVEDEQTAAEQGWTVVSMKHD